MEADKKIPEIDISDYSLTDLYTLRNSIYANYGYTFKKNWLNKYFKTQDWYQANEEFTFEMLTSVDFQNSNKLKEYENQKRKAIFSESEEGFTIRYFNDMEITNPLPQSFKSQIESYSKKVDAGYPNSPPSFLQIKVKDEISAEDYIKLLGSDEYEYDAEPYVVVYDNKGRIRRIGRHYFNENGELLCVAAHVSQTSVEIYYYFLWLNKELVQISIFQYGMGDYENPASKEDIYY